MRQLLTRIGIVVGVALFTLASNVSAQRVAVSDGFYTAQEYRALPDDAKGYYVSGLIDGILLTPIFERSRSEDPPPRIRALKTCIKEMTNTQLQAIVDKYLAEHPEEWDSGMHILTFRVLLATCKKRGVDL
jgi:hypothetical protein